MSPESPESPEIISGKGREKESGKSGISIDTGLWTSPETGPIKAVSFSPTIVVDTREQKPLVFEHLPSERGTIMSGDYSIAGLENDFSIERKSIPDLCQSLTRGRERFERELHRLRGFTFARILIVGSPMEVQRTAANPKAIFASIGAFEARYQIPFVWEPDPQTAALLIERWAFYFFRERSALGRKMPSCPIPGAVTNGHTQAISNASKP